MTVTLESVAAMLRAEAEQIAQKAADDIHRELPDYLSIDRNELIASARLNVARGMLTLEEGRAPRDIPDGEARQTTRRRISQGMTIEDIIRAYRLSLNATHNRFIEVARELSLSAESTLRGSTLLWDVGDWFVADAVKEYRAHAVSEAVRRSVEEADVLRSLLSGSILDPALLPRVRALGMDPGREHYVVFGHPTTSSQERWTADLSRYGSTPGGAALVAEVSGRTAALVTRVPREVADRGVLAVGPSAPLHEVGASAAVAEQILTLVPDGIPGLHDLSTMSWRLGIPGAPLVTQLLRQRYVEPLAGEGDFGAILLDTVQTHLAHDRVVRATAEALVIHQNTLRHRLARFEELTSCSLDSTETVVELSWVLAARQSGGSIDA
ncbi:helix-turn-helix domain-containing protein [Rhodococcus sp. F64268]|uniref:PucR family transcriptional regulator n=1 Tax=Rhodococcus sp. F64268 TaxID=2926402 RepID=UPI001FF49C47|nr:helix-turn-helix domain-containing protein [Rhodococcus sp. F64268]MCK0093837.1 helix-turn-helix domain-containing protein [Rhodococcus sp. F64268]